MKKILLLFISIYNFASVAMDGGAASTDTDSGIAQSGELARPDSVPVPYVADNLDDGSLAAAMAQLITDQASDGASAAMPPAMSPRKQLRRSDRMPVALMRETLQTQLSYEARTAQALEQLAAQQERQTQLLEEITSAQRMLLVYHVLHENRGSGPGLMIAGSNHNGFGASIKRAMARNLQDFLSHVVLEEGLHVVADDSGATS